MARTIHSRIRDNIIILAAALTTLLLSCSASVPSESDGRKVLENVAQSKGVYRVNTFRKTNGVLSESGGTYQFEFEADIECQKVNMPSSSSGVFNYTFNLIEPGSLNTNCGQVGEKQKLKDRLFFQRTEKGWRGTDGELY